jgi:hypothetical protein
MWQTSPAANRVIWKYGGTFILRHGHVIASHEPGVK